MTRDRNGDDGSDAISAIRASLRRALEPDRREHVLELARIAQHQSADDCAEVLASGEPMLPPHLVRALAIELVLRGKPVPRDHALLQPIVDAWDRCEPPVWLLPVESALPVRCIHFGGPGAHSMAMPARASDASHVDPLRTTRMIDVTSEPERAAIAAAVTSWAVGSNGVIEVKVFSLEGARGTHATADVLRLASLESAPSDDTGLVVAQEDASTVLATLFTAAHGGAYNALRSDAEARDLAWASLRALVGAGPGAAIEDVAQRAASCHFTSFGGTRFFCGIAWDLGLAVVTPERDRLTVLAATDTD